MDFLLEIGTEELPPDQPLNVAKQLGTLLQQAFLRHDMTCEHVDYWATPRRVAVCWYDLPQNSPERIHEQCGPMLHDAYDATGQPTAAALGFAKSCGTSLEALQVKQTTKGERLVYSHIMPGVSLQQLLPEWLEGAMKSLRYPRAMRWSDKPYLFIRPVHWLLALLDKEILALELLGQQANRLTYGHRFMHPGPVALEHAAHYEQTLESLHVIANVAKRRDLIVQQSKALAAQIAGYPVLDEALVDEITGLVEYPVPLLGKFASRYLQLPEAVLIEVLKHHQKCFAVLNKQQGILPAFVWVSHIQSTDPQSVIRGNERVIEARLADATFFFNQDKQKGLTKHLIKLADIQWHAKLGTLQDKTQHLESLVSILCRHLKHPAQIACRAAQLAKFDLATAMVNEFPALQGTMGYYYALYFGETIQVAQAIQAHQQLGAKTQTLSEDGRILALADRMDTLVGYFSIGLRPSGEKDPYALRRAALGVVQLLLESKWHVPLRWMLAEAAKAYPLTIAMDTLEDLLNYIRERMHQWMLERNIRPDVIQAVFALDVDDLYDAYQRIQALMASIEQPSLQALSQLNKRVVKLLSKVAPKELASCESTPNHSAIEQTLLAAIAQAEQQVPLMLSQHHYQNIIEYLAGMQPIIAQFFEEALILHPEPAIRQHRLSILQRLKVLVHQIADVTLLQLDKRSA